MRGRPPAWSARARGARFARAPSAGGRRQGQLAAAVATPPAPEGARSTARGHPAHGRRRPRAPSGCRGGTPRTQDCGPVAADAGCGAAARRLPATAGPAARAQQRLYGCRPPRRMRTAPRRSRHLQPAHAAPIAARALAGLAGLARRAPGSRPAYNRVPCRVFPPPSLSLFSSSSTCSSSFPGRLQRPPLPAPAPPPARLLRSAPGGAGSPEGRGPPSLWLRLGVALLLILALAGLRVPGPGQERGHRLRPRPVRERPRGHPRGGQELGPGRHVPQGPGRPGGDRHLRGRRRGWSCPWAKRATTTLGDGPAGDGDRRGGRPGAGGGPAGHRVPAPAAGASGASCSSRTATRPRAAPSGPCSAPSCGTSRWPSWRCPSACRTPP